jgi:hypothetical protein
MKNHSFKRKQPEQEGNGHGPASPESGRGFPPQSIRSIQAPDLPAELRMYTEEEVSAMLRVSLSQLRKWRMKNHPRKNQGPPFKKVGRSVRYPERGLIEFVNAP